MDFKDLNKKQLILLTLLITFVVSIATAIIAVSLVKQMPASVPQTINNVIQRTIEKVTTVEVPSVNKKNDPKNEIIRDNQNNNSGLMLTNNEALIAIYLKDQIFNGDIKEEKDLKPIGQGVIISDIGLVLVESSILDGSDLYKVLLDKTVFDATILKKFENGFAILKIYPEIKTANPEIENKNNIPL